MWLPKFGEGGDFWLKDKAFFFFAYEKPHQITPQDPRFVTMPTRSNVTATSRSRSIQTTRKCS